MKSLGYTINLISNTNKIIGCSEVDFQKIRAGSYIKIDNVIYQIIDRKPLFYIKDFEVINPNAIRIKDTDYLLKDDVLNISYKEYELGALVSILDGGRNYKVGDIIYINSGIASLDNSNTQQIASFEVNSISENGKIAKLGLISRGKYIISPNNVSEVYGGNGSGAKLECFYNLIDSRKLVERTIVNILRRGEDSEIYLNYVLPTGLKEGKLSTNKYELLLNQNFLGDSIYESKYEISQDFTLNYQLPLLIKGSTSPESVFNIVLHNLDNKLKEIDDWKNQINNKIDSINTRLIEIEKKLGVISQ